MNILTNDEMKLKQRKLLQLYNQSDIKFKVNLQQLIEAKQQKRDFYCFKKAESNVRAWIKKLVPLTKKVKTISLQQQENFLFKVITFEFLLMIYKNKGKINHYIKDQIKCSLYSDDIDLLEIRNHSFNKKMKSDKIKSVIAQFFKQIQYLLGTELVTRNEIKPQELIGFALQKNDIISEGFHLFYRNILAKLQVEDANNCIQEVIPEEAITNLIQYFDIPCRVFNQLYLFIDSGVFIAQLKNKSLIFGRYYENQLQYQQTSEQQVYQQVTIIPQLQIKKTSTTFEKQNAIEGNDVKIFNFILDTDRNDSQYSSEIQRNQKHSEIQTPCFNGDEELRFGKRKSTQNDKSLQNSFNKIKDRLQTQSINQIQSEEEGMPSKNQGRTPSLGSGQLNKNIQQNKFSKVMSFNDNQELDENDAPTPMLGGGQTFHFGHKQRSYKNSFQITDIVLEQKQSANENRDSLPAGIQNSQAFLFMGDATKDKKQIKQSAIRRQSYQVNYSSNSKSNESNKIEMKKSKNQIQVIDQTASRASLRNIDKITGIVKKTSEQYSNERKQTIGYSEKISNYSTCTCHEQKKHRIKLTSHIFQVILEGSEYPKKSQSSIKVSTQPAESQSKIRKYPPIPQGINSRKYSFKTDSINRQATKNSAEKLKKPLNENFDANQKRKQFLNFLKKDKSQLIKKITEKRQAKNNVSNAQGQFSRYNNKGSQVTKNRNFIKQSMFVGSYNNGTTYNPQKYNADGTKNRTTTPSHSIGKRYGNYSKNERGRQRSISPTNIYFNKTHGFNGESIKLFKVNALEHKNSIEVKSFNGANSPPLNNLRNIPSCFPIPTSHPQVSFSNTPKYIPQPMANRDVNNNYHQHYYNR